MSIIRKSLYALALAAPLLASGAVMAAESGAAAGAVAGGTAGAVVGGPVGAAVGAGAGAVIGGATSGPDRTRVIERHETTGTVVTPCSSSTVRKENGLGDTKTTTTTNCP